jgi:hypothetical protein
MTVDPPIELNAIVKIYAESKGNMRRNASEKKHAIALWKIAWWKKHKPVMLMGMKTNGGTLRECCWHITWSRWWYCILKSFYRCLHIRTHTKKTSTWYIHNLYLRERKNLRHEKSLHKQIHWKNNDVKKSEKGEIMFFLEQILLFCLVVRLHRRKCVLSFSQFLFDWMVNQQALVSTCHVWEAKIRCQSRFDIYCCCIVMLHLRKRSTTPIRVL